MAFDVEIELADIRRQLRQARRRRHYKSRLDRFRAELVSLRRDGNATLSELVAWLRRRRCRVAASTVCRYLAKLPEMGGGGDHAEF